MDENKFVTLEMFEKYHEQLMKYITGRDSLISEDEEAMNDENEEQNNQDSKQVIL